MNKILIIGQAPAVVEQTYPYDTTLLYTWLQEVGISIEQAQHMFEFEAIYNEFPGHNKNGGHLKPSKQQMIDHWVTSLENKVIASDKVWVLGNVAKDFIDKREKTWSSKTQWLYTMHPSRRNYYKFSLDRESVLTDISDFLLGKREFTTIKESQLNLF